METNSTLTLIGILVILAILGVISRQTSISGSVGGLLIGAGLGLALGWPGLVLLALYYPVITGTATIIGRGHKKAQGYRTERHGRDFWQAISNAGASATVAVVLIFAPEFHNSTLVLAIVTGLAASIADTVAGEIGVLSRQSPVSIISFRPVVAGSNGGVSTLGTLASAVGVSVFLAASYWLLEVSTIQLFWVMVISMGSSMLDSVLGSTVELRLIQRFDERIANNLVNTISTTAAVLTSIVVFWRN